MIVRKGKMENYTYRINQLAKLIDYLKAVPSISKDEIVSILESAQTISDLIENDFAELQDKLHRRNKMIAYLREEHTKRGEEIKELKKKLNTTLELIRKAGFIIQDKGNPAEHYLTEANNLLININR